MNHHRLRERLARYRLAGSADASSQSIADPWPAKVEHLRNLIAARRRRLDGRRHQSTEIEVGQEIAPGVHLRQRIYDHSLGLPVPPSKLPRDMMLDASLLPLVAFDTETTGLGSGTGQWVWMIGLLEYRQDQWKLSQWWLSRPGSEGLFLEAAHESVSRSCTLLSYNGRAFDVPMLRTRHHLHGMHNPFENKPHLDLLLSVRRRYRGQWPNCRLATVERELLDRPRSDDLPGSQAPEAWRQFLRSGRIQGVAQVLEHNRMDLESLVHLLGHLASIPDERCLVRMSHACP